jgi:hypothetical protein
MSDLKYDSEKQAPAAGGYIPDQDSDEEGVTFDKLVAEGANGSYITTSFKWVSLTTTLRPWP